MSWNSIMSFIAILAMFFPILLILVLRLGAYRSFPFLLFYYISVFIYALMKENYIQADSATIHYWGICNNLLDVPLLLLFLSYFSTSALFTRRLNTLIVLFIVFETVVVWQVGFNVGALSIILGPGILIIFGLCLFIFVRQSRLAITHRKAVGKTLISSSLVFAYGCYGILYVFFYILKTNQVADAFLIYFFVVTISSLIMCTGLIFERKRIQKLFELKKARKELYHIYKDTKRSIPLKTALLDFDRESWH